MIAQDFQTKLLNFCFNIIMKHRFAFILLILAAALLIIYFVRLVESKNEFVPARLGASNLELRLAKTTYEQARGLMFVFHMPENRGMLFIYPALGTYSFWMANTFIPLDIIWLDSEFRVVHVSKNTPPCRNYFNSKNCPVYRPTYPARYVLELNGGFVEKNNVKFQDKLIINSSLLQ